MIRFVHAMLSALVAITVATAARADAGGARAGVDG